jgi:peptide-methionine (S)-S-oxide reductase
MPVLLLFVVACGVDETGDNSRAGDGDRGRENIEAAVTGTDTTLGLSRAIFAGGCFWCEETAFEGVQGVQSVISGFVGGQETHPSYEDVSSGRTGHTEAVLVTFDPKVISYDSLLEIFWVNHDPTTNQGQFCDHGRQYRPGIFYLNDEQKHLAEASVAWAKRHLQVDAPIVTEITRATPFWPAEEYHQDFYKKNPVEYRRYRTGCGRDARLAELWGSLATQH